jgi:hypothetical protein
MTEEQPEITDEELIKQMAAAMKDNAPTQEEKTNVHTFLRDVVVTKDVTRVGNLRDDKDMNEIGVPEYTVRGSKEMELISSKIMNNNFFKEYFEEESQNTLATSLSRGGFLVKQASVQTKQIADVTKRRKVNRGWFGKEKVEESGGDVTQ